MKPTPRTPTRPTPNPWDAFGLPPSTLPPEVKAAISQHLTAAAPSDRARWEAVLAHLDADEDAALFLLLCSRTAGCNHRFDRQLHALTGEATPLVPTVVERRAGATDPGAEGRAELVRELIDLPELPHPAIFHEGTGEEDGER